MTIKRFGFGAIGFAAMLTAIGCGANAPTAPSPMAVEISGEDATAATTSYPVVTMNPNLTVTPAYVSVPTGGRIRMVNRTTRPTRITSNNCGEFNLMSLSAGYAKNTQPFMPGGKTCDYYAWDGTRKIFVGQVRVQ